MNMERYIESVCILQVILERNSVAVSFVLVVNSVNVVAMITLIVLQVSVIGHYVTKSTSGIYFGIFSMRIWLK